MPSAIVGSIRRADSDADFARFGVDRNAFANREDGRRERFDAGCFEWWYFDVRLGDGTWIVVSFQTKPLDEPDGGLQPLVHAKILRKGEASAWGGECGYARSSFTADVDSCDVRAGADFCRLMGRGRYLIEFRRSDIEARIELEAVVPPARIGTGHLLFERGADERYLGWVVPVPNGRARARYRVNGVSAESEGAGYHDHNWGNRPMVGAIHHWHWGRASAGGFDIIAANLVPTAAYGAGDHSDLILIENGAYLALGSAGVDFTCDPPITDPAGLEAPGSAAPALTYTFGNAAGDTYVARFADGRTVLSRRLDTAVYLRFRGTFALTVTRGGSTESVPPVPATWELMWFGESAPPAAQRLYALAMVEPEGA